MALKTHSAARAAVEITHYPTHNVLCLSRLVKLAGTFGAARSIQKPPPTHWCPTFFFSHCSFIMCYRSDQCVQITDSGACVAASARPCISALSWCILPHCSQTGRAEPAAVVIPTMLSACPVLPGHEQPDGLTHGGNNRSPISRLHRMETLICI